MGECFSTARVDIDTTWRRHPIFHQEECGPLVTCPTPPQAYSVFWSRALMFPDPAVIAAELASGQGAAHVRPCEGPDTVQNSLV